MKSLKITGLVIAGLLSVAGTAAAGFQGGLDVYVNTTERSAYGSLGQAYNSPDTKQFIGCSIYSDSWTRVVCTAVDAAGTRGLCSSTDDMHLRVVQSLTNDAFLKFTWDTSGKCTSLAVEKLSYYPKK